LIEAGKKSEAFQFQNADFGLRVQKSVCFPFPNPQSEIRIPQSALSALYCQAGKGFSV
jgi:hypothetical protein